MHARAANWENEQTNKQLIVHKMETDLKGKQITVEDFLELVRKEVSVVRNVHPELDEYTLYDVRLKFPNGQVELHLEFRR